MHRRALTVLLGVVWTAFSAAAADATVDVYLDQSRGLMQMDRFALGQGGLSEEPIWEGRAAEIRALHPQLIRLFVQEYFDLLPEKGRYHFDTLDQSVDLILRTGAKPLMCIAFKPCPLFPEVNQDVVEPNSYEDWEALVSALVNHYRERRAGIRYWEIMNEPDIGEDGGCPYRFKPDNYARFYQHTAAAVLRADPTASVGGPALASARSALLPKLLEVCEAQKVPLNFVSWHIYSNDPHQIRGTIEHVKGLLAQHPTLNPETLLDEWNMALSDPPSDTRIQPCFVAEVAWQMKEAGLDHACYYHIRDYPVDPAKFAPFMSPHGTAFMAAWWNRMPQFDGLFDFQNTVRPAYFTFKLLARLTGERLRLDSDQRSVHGFATRDDQYGLYNVLVWNYSSEPAKVRLNVKGMNRPLRMRLQVLDASTPSNDENARLRRVGSRQITLEQAGADLQLEPYGICFGSLEPSR
jgi:hypothetical protein